MGISGQHFYQIRPAADIKRLGDNGSSRRHRDRKLRAGISARNAVSIVAAHRRRINSYCMNFAEIIIASPRPKHRHRP